MPCRGRIVKKFARGNGQWGQTYGEEETFGEEGTLVQMQLSPALVRGHKGVKSGFGS